MSIIRKRANYYYPIFCREEDRCCTHRAFSTLKRSACYASRHYPVQATPRCCNLLIGPSNGPCNDRLNPPCPLRNARVSFSSSPLREQERTVEEGIALRAWSSWKRKRKGKGVIRAKGEQVIPDEGGEARNKKGRGVRLESFD